MVFPLIQDTIWYDLRTVPSTLIPYSVTQKSLVEEIQYQLLEPPANPWTGSGQFSLPDILTALQRRQDDVLGVTGCTLTQSNPSADITIRTILPDTVIDIRRVAWIPTSGFGYVPTVMNQIDLYANRAFDPTNTTAAPYPPSGWMQNAEPPFSFDVNRVPPITGTYDVLTVNSGGSWDGGLTKLSVPDDWTWVVRWGALFDLLSRESNAKDSLRAEYCRKRYVEGLSLLENMPTALAFRINNQQKALDSISAADSFNPNWQAAAAGVTRFGYTAANLLGVSPKAGSSTDYSATVSVVQNAPVNDGTVQLTQDIMDAILNYAQHLAMFKLGGAEFTATIPLYVQFQQKASQYNSKLKQMGLFSMAQLDISQNEEQQNPRYLSGTFSEQ